MGTARGYSESELRAMVQDVESDLVERKESLRGDAPTGIGCAFANDLPDHQCPGVVFVGVNDAGRPTGLPITDALLRQLADIKTDGNIVPPPTLTVGTHAVAGHEVAVVTVQPADSPPVRYRGRTWIRVGPRRAVASLQDERILNEKRRHRESSFDAHPAPGARLADLDLRYFEEEYLPRAVDAATLEQNDRSTIERLASMKMVASADDPRPTICGILILGKHPRDYLPGAYVQFLRIAGTALDSPIVDERLFDGPIGPLIASVRRSLGRELRPAGLRRVPQPTGGGGDASPQSRAAMGIGIAHRAARAARQPAGGPAVQRHAAANLLYRARTQCRTALSSLPGRHPGSGTGAPGSTSPAERSSAQRAGGGAARVPASAGWYTLPAGTGPGDASGDRRDAGRQRPVSARPRAASPSPGP